MYRVIKAGGLKQGGCNFDAKVRRQSFEPEDVIHAHVGGADLCARAFLTGAKIIEDGRYDKMLAERYAGWQSAEAKAVLDGQTSLGERSLGRRTKSRAHEGRRGPLGGCTQSRAHPRASQLRRRVSS